MSVLTDLPDYTKQALILIRAELLSQMRQLPWWVRYSPTRILFMDDFEDTLRWTEGTPTVALVTGIHPYERKYCLGLTTGIVAGDVAEAHMYIGAPARSKLGLQLNWHANAANDLDMRSFWMWIEFGDGEYTSIAGIRYLKNESAILEKWQYWGSDYAWHDISSAAESIQTTIPVHQQLYLTIDFTLAELCYGRLVTSKLDLDLKALSYEHRVQPGDAKIAIYFYAETDVAAAITAYVDALCISDKEA